MSQKSSVRSSLIDAAAESAAQKLSERHEEQVGGLPSRETQARLDEEELEMPLVDSDFFDFIHQAFILKGTPVEFVIRKEGNYKSTLPPPLSWDKIREMYGPGTYQVLAKNRNTKHYIKSRTETLSEDEGKKHDEVPAFAIAPPTSSAPDLSPLLMMMERQDQRAEAARREDQIRREQLRREERERDDRAETAKRESRKELLALAGMVAPALIEKIFAPKKNDAVLDILKENFRDQKSQSEKLMERLERIMTTPKEPPQNPLELIKQLNEARKEGRNEMKELLEMVEDKAEERAEEIASKSGGEEDSTLGMLLKNLGPAALALVQRGSPAALPDAGQGAEAPVVSEALPVQAAQATAAARVELTPAQKAHARDQEKVLRTLFPFFSEQMARINGGAAISASAAAKESLQLLKEKGVSQKRLLEVLSEEDLKRILAQYQVPQTYIPWFNEYYAALQVEAPRPQPPRARGAVVSPIRGTSGKPAAEVAPAGASTVQPGNHAGGDDAALGPTPESHRQSQPGPSPGNGAHPVA